RCFDGILEIIRECIMFLPEVKPSMRILMRENGIVAGNKFQTLILDGWACPGVPGTCRQWMCRRPNAEQINHHEFTKMFPAGIEKTRFGMPAHRYGAPAVQHPLPVDSFVDFCRQVLNFLVGKILASCEDAAEQQGSVD